MIRRPPRSTRTDTLLPYTTLFRSYSYGNTFISPDGEIVATCYKIDRFNAVRNTSLGGTYAYSNYGHGVAASTGRFVAINPNINADASRLMSPVSPAFAPRRPTATAALTNEPTFPPRPHERRGWTDDSSAVNARLALAH